MTIVSETIKHLEITTEPTLLQKKTKVFNQDLNFIKKILCINYTAQTPFNISQTN